MKKDKALEGKKGKAGLDRRGFAAGALAGVGLAAGIGAEKAGAAAHVSLVEASHYEELSDGGEDGE